MNGLTSVHFERGEMKLTVNHVPARVCPGCGEAYVKDETAVQLLRAAEEMSAAGAMEGILDFSGILPDDKIHS